MAIFGVDVRTELARITRGRLKAGTLTRKTYGSRSADNPAGGRVESTQAYSFEGFQEVRSAERLGRSLIQVAGRRVYIIAGTLPSGVEPETGDDVTIEGTTYEVTAVETDPDGALFELLEEDTRSGRGRLIDLP